MKKYLITMFTVLFLLFGCEDYLTDNQTVPDPEPIPTTIPSNPDEPSPTMAMTTSIAEDVNAPKLITITCKPTTKISWKKSSDEATYVMMLSAPPVCGTDAISEEIEVGSEASYTFTGWCDKYSVRKVDIRIKAIDSTGYQTPSTHIQVKAS